MMSQKLGWAPDYMCTEFVCTKCGKRARAHGELGLVSYGWGVTPDVRCPKCETKRKAARLRLRGIDPRDALESSYNWHADLAWVNGDDPDDVPCFALNDYSYDDPPMTPRGEYDEYLDYMGRP